MAVAKCRNSPGAAACIHAAGDALDAAYELIDTQREARLALCPLFGQGPYDPTINPADFSTNVTNPFFPLVVNRTLVYEMMTPDGLQRIEFTTLPQITVVNGVACRVVHDLVTVANQVIEDTLDFYAQKFDGTVWYFGEVSQSFVDGFLDNIDGSWRFGTNGAKPGIIMLATPIVNTIYRQEFAPNEAEDIAKVLNLNNTVMVPAGTFAGCLQTEDTTPIRPDDIEHKFYAPGVGFVKGIDVGNVAPLQLVQIIN